jgi:hypothetical protein
MSVHDDFFLPGYEDSILNHSVEGAAGDPQVFKGNSFAGGQQGSAAGSRLNLCGWGLPPPNQGHVPSHVSVTSNATAATLVIATSGYFGTTRRPAAEINARRVIFPKSAWGVLGFRDYTRHQEAATNALLPIFASAKHFLAKNAEGESSNKYANLQSKYAGNLAKIKSFKWHMDAWDMSDPFVIPTLIDPDALTVEDWWAERKLTGVHLLKNWGKLTLQQCCAWQQDSFDYASLEDLTSMEWAKSLMMNSCDALLIERIDEKFKDLSLYKQGGVIYIKLALDKMFIISNTVVATLQGFFDNFTKDGIAKVPNEDIHVATEQIVAVAERLANISALHSECTIQLLERLTKCSVTIFRQTFSHLLVGECLRQLRTLTTLHNSSCLGGIKKLCKEANNMFNALNVSKEWNIPQNHRINACFNCSDSDHGVPKCPKPINQSRIYKAKSKFSRSGGRSGGHGGGRMAAMAVDADMVQDVGMVMAIKPTHVGSGKAMPRPWIQSPLPVALENIRASGTWCASLVGGIPPILQDSTTPMPRILLCFLYLPPISSGLSLERAPLRRDAELLLPPWPFYLLCQPPVCSALEWVHW